MLIELLKEYNVATTALLANYWKLVAKSKENWPELCQDKGEREKDLFKDTLMQHFVDSNIQAESEQRLDKRMWLPLATRGRFFRRTVSESVKNKEVRQVLILGSGFDTLPARKSKYTRDLGVRFFEVDQPQILACKEAIYAEHGVDKNAEYIGLDYVQGNLIEELKQRSLDFTSPTLILWEGNTFYLEKTEVIRVLHELAENFQNLIITFDYMHEVMHTKTQTLDKESHGTCLEKTLDQFAEKKSPFKTFFDPAEIISICEALGIKCIDHKTAATLASEYGVDQKPYYTAKTYSMITFERS